MDAQHQGPQSPSCNGPSSSQACTCSQPACSRCVRSFGNCRPRSSGVASPAASSLARCRGDMGVAEMVILGLGHLLLLRARIRRRRHRACSSSSRKTGEGPPAMMRLACSLLLLLRRIRCSWRGGVRRWLPRALVEVCCLIAYDCSVEGWRSFEPLHLGSQRLKNKKQKKENEK